MTSCAQLPPDTGAVVGDTRRCRYARLHRNPVVAGICLKEVSMETPRQSAARIVVGVLTERAKRGDATALRELRKRDPLAAQAIEDYRHLSG